MFNDILDSRPIPRAIVEAAIEWVEYELNRIYSRKSTLYVPSLSNEAKRMLSDRLGYKWLNQHTINIIIDIGTKRISVEVGKRAN